MPGKRCRKNRPKIPNIVVVSDTHVGCRLALMAPDGAALDDGGKVMPSTLQLKIWEQWEQFWGEVVPGWVDGEPFYVVHNGDAVDGTHHNATTQWSHNLEDQAEHAYQILKPVVELCEGRYYHIRGTEAHIGKSGVEEERLAKRLGAIPNEHGQFARWELWKRLDGDNGGLIHFLHHIGTTSSSAHETSAINAELAAMYADAGRFGDEPPKVVVRSHRHQSAEIRLPTIGGYASCFVTAAWQLKTPYVWKISGARVRQPQLGGSLVRLGTSELHTQHHVVRMQRSREE